MDIAYLSSQTLEDTEENVCKEHQHTTLPLQLGNLKKLQDYTDAKNDHRIRKLAVASLMAVFKDILPGYAGN